MSETFSIYLDQITQAVIDAKDDACFKAMEHVHVVAVSKTPVETGNLAGESYTEVTPEGARVVYPGPYARYQEYGMTKDLVELRHEVGQSFFLVTSILQEPPTVLEILATELRAAIK